MYLIYKKHIQKKGGVVLKVKITSRPGGYAPEWVRNAWINIELEVIYEPEALKIQAMMSPIGPVPITQKMNGYVIKTADALEVLKLHNQEAYQWWEKNREDLFLNPEARWFFEAGCCQPVS